MNKHCNCIYCITPPYIIEKIIESGSPVQKDKALKTRTLSVEIRGRRQSLGRLKAKLTPTALAGKNRLIYDALFKSDLPGKLVRKEGQGETSDKAADEAYEGAGQTYDLYKTVFDRDSIDGKGMDLISSVHYMEGYDNAFWDGEQMVYGDGDEDMPEPERLFNRFTIAIDIIGHELTHGVTEYEASLAYSDQPGALNESFSDVFGSLVKQRYLDQTAAEANWLIGEGLFTSRVNGTAIRSMKEPGTAYDDPLLGKDPQPGHMKDYVQTSADNGGVHINSGIPNRAFYTVAMEIGGHAWEKAGKIWYITLTNKLKERSDFQEAANMTFQVAGDLFGKNSAEQLAVKKGWEAVGITINSGARQGCFGRFFGSLFGRKS